MENINYYETICNLISEKLKGEYNLESVSIHESQKNNDIKMIGFVFRMSDMEIMPCIYPGRIFKREDFAEIYDEQTVADKVAESFIESMKNIGSIERKRSFTLEENKDKIIYSLISLERNENLLRKCPHIVFNDLAIVFRVYYRMNDNNASVLIDNGIAALWRVNTENLWNLAIENMTRDYPPVFDRLDNVINLFMKRNDTEEEKIPDDEETCQRGFPMYILTNNKGYFGAGTILYKELAYSLYEKMGCDFYILPSSVNEIIIIPQNEMEDVDYLRSIVKDVNESVVSKTDYLSDSVYIYDHESDSIAVV